MTRIARTSLALAAVSMLSLGSARAQTAADPSGHWDGKLMLPSGTDVAFQVDIAKDRSGTITIPMQQLKGLPLLAVTVDGRTVTIVARNDQPMRGVVGDDNKTMTGDLSANGATVPFTMTRTGDAAIAPPATSAPIGKELEGTWAGTLQSDGGLRLELTIANKDGRAFATLVNLDQGGLRVPVVVTQKDGAVTVGTTVTPGSFSGSLSADGSELAGAWSQGGMSAPLVFKRAAGKGSR